MITINHPHSNPHSLRFPGRFPGRFPTAGSPRRSQDERYHKMDVMIHEMEQGLQAMERSIGSIGHLDHWDPPKKRGESELNVSDVQNIRQDEIQAPRKQPRATNTSIALYHILSLILDNFGGIPLMIKRALSIVDIARRVYRGGP